MAAYVVAYAKLAIGKDNSIILNGVYFGGIGENKEVAEKIARDCVNTIRGGTIIPKLVEMDEDNLILESMYIANERIQKTVKSMQESSLIMKGLHGLVSKTDNDQEQPTEH